MFIFLARHQVHWKNSTLCSKLAAQAIFFATVAIYLLISHFLNINFFSTKCDESLRAADFVIIVKWYTNSEHMWRQDSFQVLYGSNRHFLHLAFCLFGSTAFIISQQCPFLTGHRPLCLVSPGTAPHDTLVFNLRTSLLWRLWVVSHSLSKQNMCTPAHYPHL